MDMALSIAGTRKRFLQLDVLIDPLTIGHIFNRRNAKKTYAAPGLSLLDCCYRSFNRRNARDELATLVAARLMKSRGSFNRQNAKKIFVTGSGSGSGVSFNRQNAKKVSATAYARLTADLVKHFQLPVRE